MRSIVASLGCLFVVTALTGCESLPRCSSDADCLARSKGEPVSCHPVHKVCFLVADDAGDAS
ncbi:MAG: hypothetical protein H6Q89_4194, partial [Myxococcaceae bacterium]|nr:hypothetical protein [Myxococcaceae bacterium]